MRPNRLCPSPQLAGRPKAPWDEVDLEALSLASPKNAPVTLKRSGTGLDNLRLAGADLDHRATPECPEVDNDRDLVQADD